MSTPSASGNRIEAVDLARGIAMAAMAVFHFAWDLEYFGYAPTGLTREAGWIVFARTIASSFLLLVGVGLFLAHRETTHLRPFLKRLSKIAGAALLVTAATWLALPQGFVFFGILHQIAFASVAGLAFLRAPLSVTIGLAALIIAAPFFFRIQLLDHAAWWWVGLSPTVAVSFDYVPVFPWFGVVLMGIAMARIADRVGVLTVLAKHRAGSWTRPLRFVGRHGLAFYLLHQPILFGAIWLFGYVRSP